jgi:hypothetical protein
MTYPFPEMNSQIFTIKYYIIDMRKIQALPAAFSRRMEGKGGNSQNPTIMLAIGGRNAYNDLNMVPKDPNANWKKGWMSQ